jgi:glycyl-tRNA synthetase alpha chain
MADVEKAWKHFDLYESECNELIERYRSSYKPNEAEKIKLVEAKLDGKAELQPKNRFPLLAAYDLCLKCSHLFNILDARGAISVTERVGVIARVRALAVGIAKAWVDQQKTESAPPGSKIDEAEALHEKRSKKEKLTPVGS